MNDLAKNLLTWAIIAIVLVSIFNHYANVKSVPDSLSYSEFLNNVRNGQVSKFLARSFKSASSSVNLFHFRSGPGNRYTTNLLDLVAPGQQIDLPAARP